MFIFTVDHMNLRFQLLLYYVPFSNFHRMSQFLLGKARNFMEFQWMVHRPVKNGTHVFIFIGYKLNFSSTWQSRAPSYLKPLHIVESLQNRTPTRTFKRQASANMVIRPSIHGKKSKVDRKKNIRTSIDSNRLAPVEGAKSWALISWLLSNTGCSFPWRSKWPWMHWLSLALVEMLVAEHLGAD